MYIHTINKCVCALTFIYEEKCFHEKSRISGINGRISGRRMLERQ